MAKRTDKQLEAAGWSKPLNQRLPITKWKVGALVIGTLVGTKKLPDEVKDGATLKKGGHIFYLDDTEGNRTCYGAPAILWETLEHVKPGTDIYIECVGKVPTKRGQDAWNFEVRTKDN